jgi:ABC-2 type transport system permease protein
MNKISDVFNRLSKSKGLKYGTNSIILTAVVVAIAVFVNLLVGMADIKWDLTSSKLYSISDTTKNVLDKLNKDVVIYGLFDEDKIGAGSDYKEVTELLNQYAKYPRIKIEYIDPDKNPGFISSLDPENIKGIQEQDFVIKCGDKIRILSYYDLFATQFDRYSFQMYKVGSIAEQGFTGAIKYVTADKTPTIYFAEGHEENNLDRDYTQIKEVLNKNNYDVKTLNLLLSEKVPDDAETLVVASPKRDITADEREKIQEYLENGGRAVFMFDPVETNTVFTEFDKLLSNYNISLNYDMVIENDANRHVPGRNYDIVPDLQLNDINYGLNPENFVMVMPKSRSINVLKNQKDYITVTPLIKTSSQAEGEQIDATRGANNEGPLDLAIAVEHNGYSKPSKILVLGNGSFMTDRAIQQYQQYSINGLYFFLNSLSWLQDAADEDIIAPKLYDTAGIQISALQATVTGIIMLVLFPLLILLTGLFVYLRRRHL